MTSKNKSVRRLELPLFLAKVSNGESTEIYAHNQVIFSQGDRADSLFYIQEGKVKLSVVSAQGKEAVIAIMGEGEFFGEAVLAGQIRRMSTAATITDCVTTRLEKEAAVRVLHEEPAFSGLLMAHLLSRTLRIEEDLVDQLFNSSEKRLARVLLILANFGKKGKLEPIVAKISQQTLAEIVGTTRSRISFFMNKFRKLGFIEYNDHLEVRSSLLNVVLYD